MTKSTRIYRTPADWQAILTDQASSGLSIKEYCSLNQIASSNFYTARSKYGMGDPSVSVNSTSDWVSLHKPPTQTDDTPAEQWKFELDLPGGIILRMQSLS